ncbi:MULTISPECIES: hypothetical protein [Aneurinibacillus]|uniref:Uncharacterized protein n=1 Tax=Aneurinibacillus thermoaerophilus TaxID=143495 RepID=A0A1G8E036_ANETH|nr:MULTISPECIES: hypothetical protein [Aneurinibacillus]MED0677264.1 hypothetical protein [Aneurinibacillus thermoaerophilus]MED0677885.1 hypothetical protein [Aneurinibacillus thermoaerophilus]MED0738559.1 hypothetical protein [Aneurinibacillus thermoaerophilus]MED0758394.1 hypothetical protein [Aneurinibacillus thermoaerophilus]MED0760405.1 hypothetical protein [Aneurinibacillus thermoaerophilus]
MKGSLLILPLLSPLFGYTGHIATPVTQGQVSVSISSPTESYYQSSIIQQLTPQTFGASVEKSVTLPSGLNISASSSSTVIVPEFIK